MKEAAVVCGMSASFVAEGERCIVVQVRVWLVEHFQLELFFQWQIEFSGKLQVLPKNPNMRNRFQFSILL